MLQFRLSVPLRALAATGALLVASSFSHGAEPDEGKFHLVYAVTIPNLDKKAWVEQANKESYGPVTAAALAVGAEVEIEPAFLTDGVRLVFAFDYCRRHYPERNGDTRRRNEEQVAVAMVAPGDRLDLARYCKMEELSLKGEQFTVLDNAGVRLALGEASFTPGTVSTGPFGGLSSPERFTAKIIRIDGMPAEKLPLSQQAQQPYVFLMSRNRALLERIVPVAKPTSEEAKALLARLERYKEKRRTEDPKGEKERCDLYIPDGQAAKPYDPKDIRWWRALPDEPPPTAEVLYTELDNDGRLDMVVNLVELQSHGHTMVRAYFGKGDDRCTLRMNDLNQRPLFRPITILKMRDCVYAYTGRYELAMNSWQRIVPLHGAFEDCRHHDVLKWYERH